MVGTCPASKTTAFERSRAPAVALETAADANSVSMMEAKTGIDSVGALKAVGETSGRQRFRIEPATPI
jgi:hypothetical protein